MPTRVEIWFRAKDKVWHLLVIITARHVQREISDDTVDGYGIFKTDTDLDI